MALTKTQVSQLYVTLFGRASESSGSKFWQATQPNMTEAATNMLNDESAKAFFGNNIDTNAKFVNHIYQNVFGREADEGGFKFWVSALEKGNTRGLIVSEMIKAAEKNEPTFNKKVEISDYLADKDEAVMGTHRSVYVEALDKAVKEGVDAAKAYVDNVALDTWISTPTNPGKVETLTTRAEEKVANVFNAPMDYTPDGSDYIPTLQDEDKLIGIVGRSDNTLNATLGQQNADETTGTARTPNLVNIQNLNAKITGNVNTIDLRYADSLDKVNLHHFTNNAGDAATFNVLNISSELSGMRVANLDNSNSNVTFQFKQGILDEADNSGLLELADVNANAVRITSRSNDAEVEGYEKLNLVARSGLDVNALEVADLKELTITGSGNVEIASLTTDSNNEFNALNSTVTINPVVPITIPGGISAPNSLGFTKLDASKLDGKLTVDVSAIAGEWVDPSDSAVFLKTDIIGTAKDDKIYTTVVGGRTSIDGGEGKDKLILVDGSIGRNLRNEIASITNVESLEARSQTIAAQTVDFDALDSTIEQVLVRDENADSAASVFTFSNVTKEFADNKKFIIEHSVTETMAVAGPDVVLTINLQDATGSADAVTVEVVNGKNTNDVFNYAVTATNVENINLIDSDKESNIVTLAAVTGTGTLKITGGEAGDTYTINNVSSATVEAADYLSDLRLQAVGTGAADKDQSITLGKGNDIVTFTGTGFLTGNDKVVGGEGNDVVRGIFAQNTTLDVSGVEELHIASTNTINLGLGASAADFKKIVFISAESTSQTDNILENKVAQQLNNEAANIQTNDRVTIASSNITELNFSGDLNTVDPTIAAPNPANTAFNHTFNAVRLQNNTAAAVDVNINAALDYVDALPNKVLAYNVGQITVNGNTETINVNIADDDKATVTTINNIAANNLNTITLKTAGNLNLGLVSSNAANNSITNFNAEGVVGNLTARVIGLGDNAAVTMAHGNNIFDALGSAGKNINITAGNGTNNIRGSAQSDNITVGDGQRNIIDADRGDNVVRMGDGDGAVTAKDGNDTVEFGGGFDTYVDNRDALGVGTMIDTRNATTSVTKTEGAAHIRIDTDGDGANDAAANTQISDADQWIAVGQGATLKFEWLGGQLNAAATALEGTPAVMINDATNAATVTAAITAANVNFANDNLFVIDALAAKAGVVSLGGGDGNDVAIVINNGAAANRLNFTGGAGNDAAVGGMGADVFNGGAGADVFVAQSGNTALDGAADEFVISDGDSTIDAMDTIYAFDTTAGANDILNLGTTTVAVGTGAAVTVAIGAITSYSIAATGIVTFAGGVVNANNLSSVIDALANDALLSGTGATVAFDYDRNGDNTVDSTIVFQDGTADTVVELVGLTGVTGFGVAAGNITLS